MKDDKHRKSQNPPRREKMNEDRGLRPTTSGTPMPKTKPPKKDD